MNQSIPQSMFKPSFKKVYLFVIVLLFFAMILSEQNPKLLLSVLIIYFFIFVTVLIHKHIYFFLRKKKVHPYVNILITGILCVFVCWIGVSLSTQTILYDVQPEVEKQSFSFAQENINYTVIHDESQSFICSKQQVTISFDKENEFLNYTIIEIHIPLFKEFLKNSMMHPLAPYIIEAEYVPISENVWQKIMNGERQNTYIVDGSVKNL